MQGQSLPKSSHNRQRWLTSQTAGRSCHLRGRGVDPSEGLSLTVCEGVHRLQRDVKTGVGVVNREDVDAPAVVGQPPARPARGGVPASDGRRTTNVREVGERPESGEALGEHSIRAVGARDVREARRRAVVCLVIGDGYAERGRREEREGGDSDGLELHDGSLSS